MAETVIYVRKSKAEILKALRQIPAACAGNVGFAYSAHTSLLVRIGLTALGRIWKAFIDKARGGADETGLTWPALAKSTVAYKRRHPGVLFPGQKRAPYAPSWMLTERQRARWWALYASYGGAAPRGAAYHARGSNPGWAAAIAWQRLKAEGAKTLMSEYGDTKVETLRDMGFLLNTLSPGVSKTAAPNTPDQVFRPGNGEIILGTNRKWAGVHHRGGGNVPQRRLWPLPSTWTSGWWSDILNQGRQGVIDIIKFVLGAK